MLDLRMGHPEFLTEAWGFDSSMVSLKLRNLTSYEHTTISSHLQEAILAFHLTHRGEVIDREHLLVGNGASQLLGASLRAIEGRYVRHTTPYWPGLPEIVQQSGKLFVDGQTPTFGGAIEVGTHPNNPDGVTSLGDDYHVWDAAYAWYWYDSGLTRKKAKVSIFTASKAIGLASARIGWAVVPDPVLREKIVHEIEVQTGGVSIVAQEFTANALFNFSPNRAVRARQELDSRWHKIAEVLNPNVWKQCSNSGMFLLLRGREPEIPGVLMTSGLAMGLTRFHKRVNIGCSRDKFDRFAALLAEQ